MQNTITPVAPTTVTPPVESRPSPKSPPSHAFATLLRQTQIQAPEPAKAAPVPPARSDTAAGAQATTGPQGQAATAASARRRDDAASDADDADRVDSKDDTAAHATDRDDTDRAKADDGATSATGGTGLPLTHGLVAQRRLPAASPEGGAARAARTATSADADEAGAGTTATSGAGSSDASRSRGTIDLARKDEPSSTRTAASAAETRMPGAAETTAILDAAKAAPATSTALRVETPPPAALAPNADIASSAPTAPADATVATPLTSPDFAQAFAVQVSVLVQDGVQRAELHLNPADMGPVSVRIVVDGTQARIDFGADTLATRQAIAAGLPELASALRDAGMTLQGGGVSQHARDPQRDGGSGDPSAAARAPWRDDDPRPAPVLRQRTVVAGGVDLYA